MNYSQTTQSGVYKDDHFHNECFISITDEI